MLLAAPHDWSWFADGPPTGNPARGTMETVSPELG